MITYAPQVSTPESSMSDLKVSIWQFFLSLENLKSVEVPPAQHAAFEDRLRRSIKNALDWPELWFQSPAMDNEKARLQRHSFGAGHHYWMFAGHLTAMCKLLNKDNGHLSIDGKRALAWDRLKEAVLDHNVGSFGSQLISLVWDLDDAITLGRCICKGDFGQQEKYQYVKIAYTDRGLAFTLLDNPELAHFRV